MKGSDCLGAKTIDAYLDELSSAEPAPGGGSAASLVASLAASLGLMVVAVGRKREDDPILTEIGERLHELRTSFLRIACEDEEAFRRVLAAYRLPPDDPERQGRIENALREAAVVPLRMAEKLLDLLRWLIELAPLAPRQIASDVGVASHLARAALDSALLTVTANIAYMRDPEAITKTANERDRLAGLGSTLAERAASIVSKRIG